MLPYGNGGPDVKPVRPTSKMLSRIYDLNPSLFLRPNALTHPRRTASDHSLINSSQTSLTGEERANKKATFQWVKGELLGKGSYARVYLGLNITTGEIMAVKQVELPGITSDSSRHREITEALTFERKTLMDLDHTNIVQYLGYEENPKYLSIFLEYVPGGTISSCLQNHGGRFSEEVTKSFTHQILAGLEYLHSKGILHRDLKSDNILVEPTGICKIADFGISKKAENILLRARAYTAMKGTIYWMAPEVVGADKEKGYDVKVDIWSVGCVVLEMWTGKRPWHGEELWPVLMKLFKKLPPPVPADLILSASGADFRRQCFQPDPCDRPSAAELQTHPYLQLPSSWRFELSDVERSPLRRSSSQGSRKSRKSFKSITQLIFSRDNSTDIPPIPPIPTAPGRSRPQDTTHLSHPQPRPIELRPEPESGPPVVYITPLARPSSPSVSQIVQSTSKVSLEDTSESARASISTRKGFRIINPDPDPDPQKETFMYNPPPLPSINIESPYSNLLAPPTAPATVQISYPGLSSTPTQSRTPSLLHESLQTSSTPKSTHFDNSRSRKRKSPRNAEPSPMTGYSDSDSGDDGALWTKRPMDLAGTSIPSPGRKSLNRISKATGRISAHDHEPLDRPYPAQVYDNLQEFFPRLDLDKSVIAVSLTDSTSGDARKRRVKKSIRMVAEEQSNRAQSGMRRRTKFWDSKVEELHM